VNNLADPFTLAFVLMTKIEPSKDITANVIMKIDIRDQTAEGHQSVPLVYCPEIQLLVKNLLLLSLMMQA
jgi:hypothetical protein